MSSQPSAMTEERWNASISLGEMLKHLGHEPQVQETRHGQRLLRLFGCASCRYIWHLIPDGVCRQAVEVAEAHADHICRKKELNPARHRIQPLRSTGNVMAIQAVYSVVNTDARRAANAGIDACHAFYGRWTDSRDFCILLRDLFGNPFRPVVFANRWRTETPVALAAGIYVDRAFDRMTILADALEEAGCDNAEVLNHCRGLGPHARGCWVVDELLGKR